MSLERYRGAIPDWERFRTAVARPEPTTFRVRTGRIEPSALRERLEARGYRLAPVEGVPDFFRILEEPFPVSQTPEHWLGLIYVQQASTGLAAPALAPGPGDRVLDLCAAPGGKTTHMADLMDDRGCLVAADLKERRLRALLGNVYRTAHPAVLVVSADGRRFPEGAEFDRVLVDAPCSAEGNLRRKDGREDGTSDDFRAFISGVQEALLRRALEVVRPGGTVLYVTCTFAPEENEAVVDRVLRDPVSHGAVELEPLRPDAPHAPGLVSFEERSFDARLENACRIYPHHLDSGGLFMARLRKGPASERSEGASAHGWSPVPETYSGEDPTEGGRELRDEGLRRLRDEYGAPGAELAEMRWMVRGDSVWMHRCPTWPLGAWEGQGGWRMISLGLRALVDDARGGVRPTNDLLRWLEEARGERVMSLAHPECLGLLEGETLSAPGITDGWVVLRIEEGIVGRGLVLREGLRHEIPKARAGRLRAVLKRAVGG